MHNSLTTDFCYHWQTEWQVVLEIILIDVFFYLKNNAFY